jgi:uncharacterized protein YqeY
MSLLARIKADLERARTSEKRDPDLISLLVTLYSESAIVGKNKGTRESTDDEVIATVKRFVKGLEECLSAVRKNVTPENKVSINTALMKANFELYVLTEYLPKQLTENDLKLIVSTFLTASPDSNMGAVMKYFKEKHAGQYDGGLLSKIVKEVL